MKFSILVPVYNVEKYLEQCVESLLDQTYKGEYEIILVDDGSTDSSGAICDRYAETTPDKIKVVHKENGGHTSARLEAIRNATGEYCLFSDSDDFVENNLLETVDNVLSENPDTDMVMYSFCYYENGNKKPRNISVWDDIEIFEGDQKKKLYNLLITTPYINSLCTKTVKTEILKHDPADYSKIADKDMAEDAYVTSYLLTVCKKIININKALYNYRTNPKSISHSFDIIKINRKNTLFLYDRIVQYISLWKLNNDEYIKKVNARWLNETMYMFSSYYENVHIKDKKSVLAYDWSSMLPEAVRVESNNPYENPVYRSLYSYLTNKKFFYIRIYFLKKKIRKFIKKLLKRGK